MLQKLVIALTLALGVSAYNLSFAESTANDGQKIVSAETHLKSTKVLSWIKVPGAFNIPQQGSIGAQEAGDIDPNEILNIGKEIWKIIEAGQSVVDVKTDHATAMPHGVSDWTRMSGWHEPVARTYSVELKNGLGMTVVNLEYTLVSIAGGNVDGVGQYLAYVTVQPSLIHIQWGFNLNASTHVTAVYNKGTRKNPLAGMQLDIHYEVSSVISKFQRTDSFAVSGDGNVAFLNQAP
jgi:hypothetical protein